VVVLLGGLWAFGAWLLLLYSLLRQIRGEPFLVLRGRELRMFSG
jgi:hypothetical protein